MKKYVFAAATAALFATPAAAADFTGPRLEGRVAFDRVTLDINFDDGFDEFNEDGHTGGLSLGAEVGYDAQLGNNLVVGGYATADFPSTETCGEVFGEDNACIGSPRNLALGARAGVASGNALFYAKGGVSRGRFKVNYSDGEESDSVSDGRTGFHLGVGAELKLSDNSYLKAEYVRTNYNDYDFSDEDFTAGFDSHRDQVVFGVGFRF
jgi:outer membrane immunogenic protein